MIPVIYYAHSMKIYSMEQEQEELDLILATFPDCAIFNPNRPAIQDHAEPMKRCLEIVKDASINMVVFSAVFGKVTSGVMLEVKAAQKINKPVYFLADDITEFVGPFRKVTRRKKSYWTV